MWSQKKAQTIIQTEKNQYHITSGISPSGPFHIGHLREVLTADFLAWSVKNLNKKVVIHFILDDFDHLRKVYPFLPACYEQYVGKPLYLIPSPKNKKQQSYAEYYATPFLKVLKALDLDFKIYRAHQLYQQGLFNPYIEICLKKRKEIAEILKKVAGTKTKKDFYPFRPLCPQCHSLIKTKILRVDFSKKQMEIKCKCGFRGKINYLNGGGKLIWRAHWPSWWQIFKTDAEPYGKEHATIGGSYDTGKVIAEKIFKTKPPLGIPYDLIYLKGAKGKMSSSLGNVISAEELEKSLPQEIIKYFILKVLPEKPIYFDPKDSIRLSEEIAADLKRYQQKKLSQEKIFLYQYIFQTKNLKEAKMIPWGHLLLIVQLTNYNYKKTAKILAENGHDLNPEKIKNFVPKAKYWLKKFADQNLILKINFQLPKIILKTKEKKFLKTLSEKLKEKNYSSEELQNVIFQLIKQNKLKPQQGFGLIYHLLINQNSGPKAGELINLIGPQQLVKKIKKLLKN